MEKPRKFLDIRKPSVKQASAPPPMGPTHTPKRRWSRRRKPRPGVADHKGVARRKPPKWVRVLTLLISLALIVGGIYLGYILIAPKTGILPVKTEIDLNTADDAQDSRNRIQIEKINLEVPFFTGGVGELEKGAWHRFPERGNPEKGGNFILSAHRFRIANNPALTKVRSPFYNLDKLQVGDTMRVFYDGQWYDYTVTKTYSVKPNEIQIEAPSKEAKLTLYSCSLGGSSDGRIVIEAVTKTQPPASESPTATPSPTPKPSTTQSPKVTPKSSTQKKTAPKAMPGFVFPTPPQRP